MFNPDHYPLARMKPAMLKSPWWIGHIPFAFELIRRLRPRVVAELGTYSGSSFAAFCQAVEAENIECQCYGVDLWEGDIHMGQFDESLYKEVSDYMDTHHPRSANLIRREFNDAATQFEPKSVDLLHIDGTHTYEAVSNDYHTWLPKMSDKGVILFHDTNVTYENAGPAAEEFGVKPFFDSVKVQYPHIEFTHCYGLGVLMVGRNVPGPVLELAQASLDSAFLDYFARLGADVSRLFEDEGGEQGYYAHAARRDRTGSRLLNKVRGWAQTLIRPGTPVN